jgi:hypothetical protein
MDDFNDFEFEEDTDSFDGFDDFDDDETTEGENDNRTFLLVAGGLGIVLVLALVCMVVYALVIQPSRNAGRETQVAEVNATNTSVAMAARMTALAQAWTLTPTVTDTPAPNTATASPTPVLAPTDTPMEGDGTVTTEPDVTQDPRTATVAALLTEQAGGGTATPTATGLPDTGFADDFGIAGMIALAAALVVVIFLARRLRTAST